MRNLRIYFVLVASLLLVGVFGAGATSAQEAPGGDSQALAANTGPPDSASACPIAGPRSDEFSGTSLDSGRWTVINPDATYPFSVADGELNLPIDNGSLYSGNETARNIIVQPLEGSVSVTAKIRLDALDENYQQAGLRVYAGNDNWASVHMVFAGGRDIEFIWEADGNPRNTAADKVGGIPEDAPYEFYARLVSDGSTLTAFYSFDGITFDPVGQPGSLATFVNPQIGPVALSDVAPSVPMSYFDWIRFDPEDCAPAEEIAPTVSHDLSGETNSNGDYIETATLAINAVDNEGGSGVASTEINVNGSGWVPYEEPVTFNELGGYSVEYRATDNAENVSTVGTANFSVVGPGEPKLANKAAKKKVKLKAKKKSGNVAVTVSNTGSAAQSGVKVCATAPKAKIKVTGKKCVTVGNLNAGQKKKVKFKFKTTKKLVGKKAKITVKATAPGQTTKTAKITVQQAKK